MTEELAGSPRVFWHGWGFDARVWGPLGAALAEGQPNIPQYAPNLPGYGTTPPCPSPDEAIATLMSACPVPHGEITLVAWSLGGLLALRAATHPTYRQAIGQLVLINSTASFIGRDHWPFGTSPELLASFRLAVTGSDSPDQSPAPARSADLRRFAALINQGDQAGREAQRFLNQLGPGASPEVLGQGLDWLEQLDMGEQLADVRCPVLILHGSADPLMPLAGAEALAQRLPQARLHALPGHAHGPFLSRAGAARCAGLILAQPVGGHP